MKNAPGSKLTEAMISDLESELSKARKAEAERHDYAGRGVEPPDMSDLRRTCETTAKAAEDRCRQLGLP